MLSEAQQRCLAEIEDQLRLSDSQLTYRFSLFAELVAGQEMPQRERLPLTLRARMARLGRIPRWPSRPAGGGWGHLTLLLLLLPAILVVITCTLLLAGPRSHGGAGCSGQSGADWVPVGVGSPPSRQSPDVTNGCATRFRYPSHR